MKKIDFTQPGGFPLTQDILGDMQHAYLDVLKALAGVGGAGTTPMILSGMVETVAGSTVTITDGWFYWNGAIIKFTGSTHLLSGSFVPVVLVTTTSSSLVFYNATSPTVITEQTAAWAPGPPLTTTAAFPYSTMVPFGRENAWSSIAISTIPPLGGASGTLYYRKNFLSNTLELRGSVTFSRPDNVAAAGATEAAQTLCTLPAGYTPNNQVYFRLPMQSGIITDCDPGYGTWPSGYPWVYVQDLNGSLDTSGNFIVTPIHWNTLGGGAGGVPVTGTVTPYTIEWNMVVPLD